MTPSILIRVATALMVGATFLPAQSKPSAQGGGPAKARAEAPSVEDKAQVRLAEVMAMLQDEALTPAQRAEATKKLEEVMAALASEKMASAKAGQEPKVVRKVERKLGKNGEVVEETVTSSSSSSNATRDSQSSSSSSSDKQSSSDKKSASDEKSAKSADGKSWKAGSKAEADDGGGKAEGGEDKPRRLRMRWSGAAPASEPQEPAPATAPEAKKPPKAPRAPKAPKAAVAPAEPAEPVEVRVVELAPGQFHVVHGEGGEPLLLSTEPGEVVELPQLVELRAEFEKLTPRILEQVRVALPEGLGEGSEALRIARLELEKVRGQLGTEMHEAMEGAREELELARVEQGEARKQARVEMLRYRDSLQRHEDGKRAHAGALRSHEQAKRAHDEALRVHDEAKRAHDEALRVHDEAKRAHDEALRSHEEAARAHAEAMAAERAVQDEARGPRGRRVVVDRARGQRGVADRQSDDRQSVERVYEVRTRSVEGQDDEIRRLIDEMRGEMQEIRSLMQELRERADQAHERRTGRAGRSGNSLLGGQRPSGSFPASAEGRAVGTSPFGATSQPTWLAPAAPGSTFGSQPVPGLPPAPPAPPVPGDAGVGALSPLETRGVPVLQGLPVLGNLFTTRTAPAPASTLPPVQTQPLGR